MSCYINQFQKQQEMNFKQTKKQFFLITLPWYQLINRIEYDFFFLERICKQFKWGNKSHIQGIPDKCNCFRLANNSDNFGTMSDRCRVDCRGDSVMSLSGASKNSRTDCLLGKIQHSVNIQFEYR